MAAILFFLGINKLIALQTWLFEGGRVMARAKGWYAYGRVAQAVFLGFLALAMLAALAAFFRKWRRFISEQPLVPVGVLLLSLLVFARASKFTHVQALLHLNLNDDSWGWIFELGGTACIAWCAAAKARRLGRGPFTRC